jgi:monoamine oxidase
MLHDAGVPFVLLEARDRVGGRTATTTLSDGTPIERGAQSIHGALVATWQLIARFGGKTHLQAFSRESAPVYSGGAWLRDHGLAGVFDQLSVALEAGAEEGVSLHDAVTTHCKATDIGALESLLRVVAPGDPREITARSVRAAWVWTRREPFWLIEGYSALWTRVSSGFREALLLRKPVTRVEHGADGITAVVGAERFAGRVAIITVPIGVLQAGAIEFEPALPDWKTDAIHGLGSGALIKVVAEFTEAFWEEALGSVPSFLSVDGPFGVFTCLHAQRPGPPALASFLGGELAAASSGQEAATRRAYVEQLGTMFHNVDVASKVVSVDVVDWLADEWTRGGASVVRVGAEQARADMAAPTPPLLWAGEAVAGAGEAETVHGAIASGFSAATQAMHLLRAAFPHDAQSRMTWDLHDPTKRQEWWYEGSGRTALRTWTLP